MKPIILSLTLLAAALLPSCKSTGAEICTGHQAVVEAVAKAHPACTRLSMHCTPAGGSGPVACASTSAAKVGKPSDPEDVKAMQSGADVVLDAADSLDVTVPICQKDGKFTAACGVTLKKSAAMSQQQLIDEAHAIAKAVEAGAAKADACGGDCASGCCSGDKK